MLIGVVLCGLGARARANPKDFVIYAPGLGGSQQEAKPYLDTFLRHLEKLLGWPEASASGEYTGDLKSFEHYIEEHKPGFGLISTEAYLGFACKKAPISLLASVIGLNSSGGAIRYHVVVKAGGAKTLEELQGKRLASNHLQDLRYVSRVIFGGKIDAERYFQLQPTNSPIKPFKSVDRGEADAALVDDDQYVHMKTLPFGKTLAVVYSSDPAPPYPVISFDDNVKGGDREAVRKAILGFCSSKGGVEICKSLRVTRFQAPDTRLYSAALERYCHK
jgi:hypothetical protein